MSIGSSQFEGPTKGPLKLKEERCLFGLEDDTRRGAVDCFFDQDDAVIDIPPALSIESSLPVHSCLLSKLYLPLLVVLYKFNCLF
jgi:hypothetical protein